MSKREVTCEACGGSGEIVFAIWVHEPGCGYGHESSDARPCEECIGAGRVKYIRQPVLPQVADDDLPF